MVPFWITPNQGVALNPPAEVLVIGDSRSAASLQAAVDALHFTEAKRYQPTEVNTFCNIATADFCQIVKAPLPHRADLGDGKGIREVTANVIYDALNAIPSKFPGWTKTGTIASALAVKNLSVVGIPQVAVWKNPSGRAGHITPVIAKPAGKLDKPGFCGVWVAGAGSHCSNGCPIEEQFGGYTKDVLFFAFNGN